MSLSPPQNTGPVREAHRFEEARLDTWMAEHVDGYSGALHVRQFKGGQSNPTYWLADRDRQYALRKKPPGELLQSAHAVDREYRVMQLFETPMCPPRGCTRFAKTTPSSAPRSS